MPQNVELCYASMYVCGPQTNVEFGKNDKMTHPLSGRWFPAKGKYAQNSTQQTDRRKKGGLLFCTCEAVVHAAFACMLWA